MKRKEIGSESASTAHDFDKNDDFDIGVAGDDASSIAMQNSSAKGLKDEA